MTSQYGAYALHDGYVRLQAGARARTHVRTYIYVTFIVFPQQKRVVNAPQGYV